jgi:CheY-like chemotaxis protein
LIEQFGLAMTANQSPIEVPSLLITDDDRGFRETLREVFEPLGFRTLIAGDGEEALEIVEREVVNLLLVDMHMPKLTGLETVQRVKQRHELLPCILMSAEADRKLVRQARLAKAFTVLSKPVSRQRITRVVGIALARTYNWPLRRSS